MEINGFVDLSYTQNRELSWLDFNRRVLEESMDRQVPLMERLKFISIFVSNLNEFFMVRVGSLYDLSQLKKEGIDNKTGLNYSQQLALIYEKMPALYRLKDFAQEEVDLKLAQEGVVRKTYDSLDKASRKTVDDLFDNRILPIVSPIIINSHHPFPHLQNDNLTIICTLTDSDGEDAVGIVQFPSIVNDIVYLPGEGVRYILKEEIILNNLEKLFTFYKIKNRAVIMVTRNADLNLDDEIDDADEDFRRHMKKALKKRARLAPIRLEIEGQLPKSTVQYLIQQLELSAEQVYFSTTPLKMNYVFGLFDQLSPAQHINLTYPEYRPTIPPSFDMKKSLIDQILEKDHLLFFPFHSMEPFIQLLKQASNDPSVISIKITIYRLHSISKVAEHLANAAENGKEVTVLMELRARFDEDNNINWSERLEEAGCTVIYGFEEYKVHSKICLITRHVDNQIQLITQIGTGNYNEKTAKLYTDLSLLTADQGIGKDAQTFFKNMLISNLEGDYQHLLVAPYGLKSAILRCIDHEIKKAEKGLPAHIRMKCNSITERGVIDKLAEASQAGVQVELNVRGICSILPGVDQKTENIEVTSIVGRFLEHPRIYIFGADEHKKIYISSADLMTRNLTRRVEIACPIYDPQIRQEVEMIMDVIFKDDQKGRRLCSDGSYEEIDPPIGLNSQETFMSIAREKEKRPIYEKKTPKAHTPLTPSKVSEPVTEEFPEVQIEKELSMLGFFDRLKLLFFKKRS